MGACPRFGPCYSPYAWTRSHLTQCTTGYPCYPTCKRTAGILTVDKQPKAACPRTLRRNKNEDQGSKQDMSYLRKSTDGLSHYSTTKSTHPTLPAGDTNVYQGSVTPLPRMRFYERVRNDTERTDIKLDPTTSPPRLTPASSKNPFDEEIYSLPTERPQITPRKKKKRPPPPPQIEVISSDVQQDENKEAPAGLNSEKENNEQVVTSNIVVCDSSTKVEESSKKIEPSPDEVDNSKDTSVETVTVTVEPTGATAVDEVSDVSNTEIVNQEVELIPSKATPEDFDEINSPEGYTKLDNEGHSDVTITVTHDDDRSSAEKSDDSSSILNSSNENLTENSEKPLSSSEMSLYNEADHHFLEENADLLEMVHKLHMEIDKLTDDTNNNIINNSNQRNLNENTQSNYGEGSMTSKLMKVKKDDEWISP